MHDYIDPVRQVEEIKDGEIFQNGQMMAYDVNGVPNKMIKPDALYNDLTAFWSFHERKLLLVIIGCSIYFLGVLF